MEDIHFKFDETLFSYRVGGVLIHDGKVLMQNSEGDDGYSFVGGHVAFGEITEETIVREFKEEIGADIKVERLLMVNENLYKWGKRLCHQINFFYLISLKDETQIPLDGDFKAFDELGGVRAELNMCWIPFKDIPNKKIYPDGAKRYLWDIPDSIVHFVQRD